MAAAAGEARGPRAGGAPAREFLFNRAPHPNAAKIYINWFLSKEGQTIFARATGYVSARLDVPTDHTEPWQVPVPEAIKSYGLEAIEIREKVVRLVKEAFGL